jgi:hypothetical protein
MLGVQLDAYYGLNKHIGVSIPGMMSTFVHNYDSLYQMNWSVELFVLHVFFADFDASFFENCKYSVVGHLVDSVNCLHHYWIPGFHPTESEPKTEGGRTDRILTGRGIYRHFLRNGSSPAV